MLYILRHGEALSLGVQGIHTDEARPLSEKGKADVRAIAQELLRREGRPTLILHSPIKRAVQTAEIAAAEIKPRDGTKSFRGLANTLSAESLSKELAPFLASHPELMIVGHQPQLGELVVFLTQGPPPAIRPGGLLALEIDAPSRGRLAWAAP